MANYPYKLDSIPSEKRGLWIPISAETPFLMQHVNRSRNKINQHIFSFRDTEKPFFDRPFEVHWLKKGRPLLGYDFCANDYRPEDVLKAEEKRQFSYHLFKAWLEACRFLDVDRLPKGGVFFEVSQYEKRGNTISVYRLPYQERTGLGNYWFLVMPSSIFYETIVEVIRKKPNLIKTLEKITVTTLIHEIPHLLSDGKYFGLVRSNKDWKMLSEIRSHDASLLYMISSNDGIDSFNSEDLKKAHFKSRVVRWNNMDERMSQDEIDSMQIYYAFLNIASRFCQANDSFRKDFEQSKQEGTWIDRLCELSQTSVLFAQYACTWAPQIARMPLARIHLETERNIKNVWGKSLEGTLGKSISCFSLQAKEAKMMFQSSDFWKNR